MIKHARAIGLGLFVGVAVAFLLGPSASAYIGQNPYILGLTGPATAVNCANDALLTASVISVATGQPVDHQFVLWEIKRSPSPDDRLSDSRTTTGADGKTSVTLTFASVGGQRTIRATVATFGIDVLVTCNYFSSFVVGARGDTDADCQPERDADCHPQRDADCRPDRHRDVSASDVRHACRQRANSEHRGRGRERHAITG